METFDFYENRNLRFMIYKPEEGLEQPWTEGRTLKISFSYNFSKQTVNVEFIQLENNTVHNYEIYSNSVKKGYATSLFDPIKMDEQISMMTTENQMLYFTANEYYALPSQLKEDETNLLLNMSKIMTKLAYNLSRLHVENHQIDRMFQNVQIENGRLMREQRVEQAQGQNIDARQRFEENEFDSFPNYF